MKKMLLLLTSVWMSFLTTAQDSLLTVDDIFGRRLFTARMVTGFKSMNNGIHYTLSKMNDMTRTSDILRYEYKTGKLIDTILQGVSLIWNGQPLLWTDYDFDASEMRLLLTANEEPIYRHSTRADFFIYDLKKKKLEPLSDKGKQMFASFSPDGNKVAFVRDNNIFIRDLVNHRELQITFDGRKNEIINGACDWVYEEEFSFDKAYEWSPDGKRIAYYKFDESHVREFTLTFYDTLYPREERYKYPKAGEDNSLVSIHIYELASGKTIRAGIGYDKNIYIPRIRWMADPNKLCIMRLNRHQNKLELLACNAATGIALPFYTETNDRYIDIEINDNMHFTSDGQFFFWLRPEKGYTHLFKLDMKGNVVMQLTRGQYDVTRFYGYDEQTRTCYHASAEVSPHERQIYSITESGKKKLLSRANGTNSAQFSTGFKYFINTWSDANTPYVCELYSSTGRFIRTLEDNQPLKERMKKYRLSSKTFFTFTTTQGVQLNGWMIKPVDFDERKKYPVLQYMYGGPGSNTVNNAWEGSNYFFWQLLAQKGYLVVSVDNRGTGARGEEFQKCTYLNLGKLETIDQIETARYLTTLPYVDKDRIGAFGWSFGGYLVSLLMTKGADYFKAGIAVAPVTNWRFYDTIYTERYLRTPQENAEGYDDNSPVNFADRLKGRFLLIHGTADDNVHFQNTVELVAALVKHKKQFETFFYPNSNHSLPGMRLHLYTRMENFILQNL